MTGLSRHPQRLIHVFRADNGDVSRTHVERAIRLGRRHSELVSQILQYLRNFRQRSYLVTDSHIGAHDLKETVAGYTVEEFGNDGGLQQTPHERRVDVCRIQQRISQVPAARQLGQQPRGQLRCDAPG